jgi:hypothetical protein
MSKQAMTKLLFMRSTLLKKTTESFEGVPKHTTKAPIRYAPPLVSKAYLSSIVVSASGSTA